MQPQYTRVCSYCQEPREPLHKQRGENYGKLICDPCFDDYMRWWRRTEGFRERMRASWNDRYARAVAKVRAFKDRPCMDCGGRFPHYVMHFDHPDPKIKTFNISQKACKGLTPAVLAEIEKCDLVCANCHAIRTERQIEQGILSRPGRPRSPAPPAWTGPGSLEAAKNADLSQSA